MPNPFEVHARIRVTYGEYRGRVGTVLTITPSGHNGFDYVAVRLDTVDGKPVESPHFFFQHLLEVIPSGHSAGATPKPCYATGNLPQPRRNSVLRGMVARTQRFGLGDTVLVSNPARLGFMETVQIEKVIVDPPASVSLGGTGNSARYTTVRLPYRFPAEYYDWELSPV